MSQLPDEAPRELALLREAMQEQQAPASVEARLVRRFRKKHSPKPVWWRVWGAAAAVSVVVVAVMVLAPRPGRPPDRAPEQAAGIREEVVTDYFPIGFPLPLRANEYTQVIRISVPETEMMRFGLPVTPGPGSSLVEADVVLGEDGVARAIRFVW